MFKGKLKLALATSALAVSMLVTGCGGDSKSPNAGTPGKQTVLKVSFNQSENHPQFKALTEMSKKLEAETKGAYKLDIQPNELLGNQKDSFELVQAGTIQMAMVANSIVENVNKDFAVIGLPYVYDSQEHQKKVFTSGILKELFASTSKNNFEVLTAFTAGARSVYTDKAITSPEDLKGYKIRVMQSSTMIKMLGAMGGVGTPMGQGEVYTAIQQKTINGGENNEITYADLKHYEVAPVFSYTRHLMVPDLLIINSASYKAMPADVRKIFDKLVIETTHREFELWDKQIDSARKTAMDKGAKFIDVDIKPFQANCKALQEDVANSSATSKKLYEAVRELAKK